MRIRLGLCDGSAPLLPLALLLQAVSAFQHLNWDLTEHGIQKGFKWHRPFPADGTDPGGFEVPCKHIVEFHAHQYRFSDIHKPFPDGLKAWAEVIEAIFEQKYYPGGWDGADLRGKHRDLLMMEYKEIPEAVREWIKEQQKIDRHDDEKAHLRERYAVFEKPKGEVLSVWDTVAPTPSPGVVIKDEDKIVVFAPGALYDILPLWVAKGSPCESTFFDLSKYSPVAKDKSVIAWPQFHSKPDKKHHKEMIFSIEAMYVEETPHGREWREMWERHHVSLHRNERKNKRQERQNAKKEIEQDTIVKDEL